jgi:AbiV family abortive infection protein
MTKIELKYNSVSREEFKKGAVYSLVNAHELYGDALIMDALGRTPRTYSLMKLSLEEIAKALMLFEIYLLKQNEELFQERISMLLKGLESHNPKTKYAIQFLISKQNEFINFHPNPEVKKEDSNLNKELNELKGLLDNVTDLDSKKNTNLYTSLIENEFKPPALSVDENDVQNLTHLTFPILIKSKRIILKDNDEYYSSLGIDPEKLKKLDPNTEARRMHKIQMAYWNHLDDVKRKYPHVNFEDHE